jgi:hypothetical protein
MGRQPVSNQPASELPGFCIPDTVSAEGIPPT